MLIVSKVSEQASYGIFYRCMDLFDVLTLFLLEYLTFFLLKHVFVFLDFSVICVCDANWLHLLGDLYRHVVN